MNLSSKELSLEQELIAKAKLIRCRAPLPETMLDPVLTRMLEVMPSEEGKGGNKEATASAKEVVRKGGIENPSIQGKKRTVSEDPKTMVSKRGKKSSSKGPATERCLGRIVPPRGSALHRAVSKKGSSF